MAESRPSMKRNQRFMLNDVFIMLEYDDVPMSDVGPPGDGTVSDEDDSSDDNLQGINPNNLFLRQLPVNTIHVQGAIWQCQYWNNDYVYKQNWLQSDHEVSA